MAKGDVTLQLSAESAQAIQSILKATEALKGAGNQARQFGDEIKKSGDVGKEIFEGMAGAMGLVTTASGAAAAAVTLTLKTIDNYLTTLENRANALRGKVTGVNEAAFSAGVVPQAPQLIGIMDQAAGQVVGGARFSEAEMGRVGAAVINQAGAKIGPKKIGSVLEGALQAYQQARAGGASEAEGTDVAAQYARLSETGNQELAYAAHVFGFSDEDMTIENRIAASHGDTAEGLRMIFAAHTKDERMKTLTQLENIAIGRKVSITHLLDNPGLIPKNLRPAAADLAQAAAELQIPTMAAAQVAVGGKEGLGGLSGSLTDKNTQAIKEQKDEINAQIALARQRLRERVIADQRKEHPLLYGALPDFMLGGDDEITARKFEPGLHNQLMRLENPNAPLTDPRFVQPSKPGGKYPGISLLQGIHDGIQKMHETFALMPYRNNDRYLRSNWEGQG